MEPTRRSFIGMIGAAVAGLAASPERLLIDRQNGRWTVFEVPSGRLSSSPNAQNLLLEVFEQTIKEFPDMGLDFAMRYSQQIVRYRKLMAIYVSPSMLDKYIAMYGGDR